MNFGKIIPIAGFPIHEAAPRELSTFLLTSLRRNERVSLLFANCNFVVQCKALLKDMCNESVVIVNDGIGLDIAARCLHGRRFKANLNGTDFTPYLFRQSARPLRVFLTVVLPLARNGVFAGLSLGFARALGDFGVTLMIAGNIPGLTQTGALAIYDAVQANRDAQAAGMAATMTALAVVALYLGTKLVRRRPHGW